MPRRVQGGILAPSMAAPTGILYVAWKGGYFRSASGAATVGRDPSCDIILSDDVGVSRRHARFLLLPSAIKLEDLGSRNGTFVDGRLLTGAALLSGGEWVRVGDTELRAFRDERSFRLAVTTPTPLSSVSPDPSGNASTITSNIFAGLLRDVARVALSRPEEVTSLVEDALSVAERLAPTGELGDGDAIIVADFALREATVRREGAWVRRVLGVYSALRRPMSAELAARVVDARGKVDDFPEEEIGAYIAVLAAVDPVSPAERALVAQVVRLLTEEGG